MSDLNKLVSELNSKDLIEIYKAIREQMVLAIEQDPCHENEAAAYYEALATKIHAIWFAVVKLEKELNKDTF